MRSGLQYIVDKIPVEEYCPKGTGSPLASAWDMFDSIIERGTNLNYKFAHMSTHT